MKAPKTMCEAAKVIADRNAKTASKSKAKTSAKQSVHVRNVDLEQEMENALDRCLIDYATMGGVITSTEDGWKDALIEKAKDLMRSVEHYVEVCKALDANE